MLSEEWEVLTGSVSTFTIEQFVAEVEAHIRWYNEKRIKISLGSLSPVE
tara:strand:+ start:46 stop:192 length:147 start_codon:yes stop_codon:yes gene_type:complete